MNSQKFLERWRSFGPTKQLAILLAAMVKEHDGQVTIPMSALDDISGGQTVVYREDGDKIHLLFSGEFTNLYTIEESVHERTGSWTTPPGASRAGYDNFSTSQPARVRTDEELADLEDRTTRAGRLKQAAREARTVPIASSRTGTAPHRRPSSPAERQAEDQMELDQEG